MLNIELAVLQSIDQEQWWTASEISEKTRVQELFAVEVLKDLSLNGMIETRFTSGVNNSDKKTVQWRSKDLAISNYLKSGLPCY